MRAWYVLAVSVTLLAGCGASPSPIPPRSTVPAAVSPAVTAAAGPADNARQVWCEIGEAHIRTTIVPAPDDVAVGPLVWQGLRTWATADPSKFGENDDYKLGATVKAGATVTVAVAPDARAFAGLSYGQRWQYSPVDAVTFQACDNSDTVFIGGFHVVGRRCVPFDIRVGDDPPTRVVVSFFTGKDCP
ncbi:MAG TPA: hypothetical protein VGP31_05800 [Planosporangium sp.]|jgi:hypothetical protein|nr:hypothetical protein [Planosporangium sp.]